MEKMRSKTTDNIILIIGIPIVFLFFYGSCGEPPCKYRIDYDSEESGKQSDYTDNISYKETCIIYDDRYRSGITTRCGSFTIIKLK